MTKWAEIIEKNHDKLMEELQAAFREAVDYRNLQYIVEINEEEEVYTWACIAGSQSMSIDVFNDHACEVARFCFLGMDIEVTEEDFRRHMTEDEQDRVEKEADEEGYYNFMRYIYESRKFSALIETVEQEWLDWYKDEYAYSEAEGKLEQAIQWYSHIEYVC